VPISFGSFELSPESYELRRDGEPVRVEPRVLEVIAYLVAHRDRVVPKEELLDRLWPGRAVSESALTRAIRDARRALGDTGSKEGWIRTVHGRGFRFAGDPVESASHAAAEEEAARFVGRRGAATPDSRIERLLLIGRRQWNKRTEVGFHAAVGAYEQALELEPLDSRAWVGLAECYNLLANHGFVEAPLTRSRALAAAERALELDPDSAGATRALATAAYLFDFDWARSERLFRRALELEPHDARSHYLLGILLGTIGRFDEAFSALERSAELEPLPLHAPAALGWILHRAGRSAEAVAQLRRVLPLEPGTLLTHWWLGEALVEVGDFDGARASYERALELGGRPGSVLAYLGHAEGRAGRHEAARSLLAELDERARTGHVPPYYRALVLVGLADRRAALAELERAWEARDSWLRDLAVDPSFASLREDARYRRILRRLGLADGPGPGV